WKMCILSSWISCGWPTFRFHGVGSSPSPQLHRKKTEDRGRKLRGQNQAQTEHSPFVAVSAEIDNLNLRCVLGEPFSAFRLFSSSYDICEKIEMEKSGTDGTFPSSSE